MTISNILIYRKTTPTDHPEANYRPLDPDETMLHKGYRHAKGAMPLSCDIIRERDVALTMRDGVTIYANVFRPATDDSVPAIINWAPYGKGGTGFWALDNSVTFPNRFGIKRSALSGLESWEACDPAYWCAHGFAIVQIDARGAFNSEGDIWFLNRGEGLDVHDSIEALATLDWCSGKIGMAGNSWLAMQQWRGGEERPPHLAALAPWEGLTDPYRDTTVLGGIPDLDFACFIRDKMFGHTQVVDIEAMVKEHPLFDEYWQDCCPEVSRIEVPTYVVASYTNALHAAGTIRGWYELTAPKWLRIHNTQEWPDFYAPENVEDLRRFFDRYLKEIENGWEETPQVRLSILDPGHKDTVNRVEDAFPPNDTSAHELFLNAKTGTLEDSAPTAPAAVSYAPRDKHPTASFDWVLDRDIEVFGAPLVTLYTSVEGAEDMDVHVWIEKLDRRGRRVFHQVTDLGFPLGRWWMPKLFKLGAKPVAPAIFRGAHGRIRASRRGLDETAHPYLPRLALTKETPLPNDGPVELQIPLTPIGMRWHSGETLRLNVSGLSPLPLLLPGLPEPKPSVGDLHHIHTGGTFNARLNLRVRPATRT